MGPREGSFQGEVTPIGQGQLSKEAAMSFVEAERGGCDER